MTRSADEIGAGLALSRPGVAFALPLSLHIVGLGGTAATGAALHAAALGVAVTGCDHQLSSEAAGMLQGAGVRITDEGDLEAPRAASLVAVSKAITSTQPNHPQLQAARDAGVPLISLQQVIADAAASRGGALIGVSGTHGKTTSTGWLLATLRASGLDPSAFVGGPLPAGQGSPAGSPAHLGTTPGFIVEADEYGGNFDPYAVSSALILNIDWDHPDIFADRAAAVTTFVTWARPVLNRGVVVVNVGDRGGAEAAASLTRHDSGKLLRYAVQTGAGERVAADVTADLELGEAAHVSLHNLTLNERALHLLPQLAKLQGETLQIGLLGAHNAANALGVATLAAATGGRAEGITTSLASYPGVGRRMEVRFDNAGITVLDDYGHHPTAIDATISTVRLRYPGRPLVLAIEPLTYHRTAALLQHIAQSCAAADQVVVADIFAVRDTDLTIASAQQLAEAIEALGTPARAPGSVEASADSIASALPEGAVVLVMGGGRSTDLATRLARALAGR
jgi:UDP-N-acetylmuramate--alanine ligase